MLNQLMSNSRIGLVERLETTIIKTEEYGLKVNKGKIYVIIFNTNDKEE